MTRSKLVRSVALGGFVAFLMAACGVGTSVPMPPVIPTPEPEEDNQPLKVATAPPFPPFEFKEGNDDKSQLVGFDIDLINAISQQTGRKIEIQTMSFDELTPALQAGKVDVAISGIAITEERSQLVDFSRPYIDASLVIATRTDSQNIASEADLKGKTLAVELGTPGADKAIEIMGSKIITSSSPEEALEALTAGEVDAVIHSRPLLLAAIATQDQTNIRLVDSALTESFYGIALPQNSPHTRSIDRALGELMENGTYTEIYQKWFDSTPSELPKTAF
ncbi:MAG TPA: basic amino acid ABC transporter substrate-binding protein [Trichocoleus sp.]